MSEPLEIDRGRQLLLLQRQEDFDHARNAGRGEAMAAQAVVLLMVS